MPTIVVPARIALGLLLFGGLLAADWPQWRGPQRSGTQPQSSPLADAWPGKGLAKLWESEPIPSDDDGGHGSVVVAGGRVYAALVWHTDVPTETRAIDDLVLRDLGYQSVAGWPTETVEKLERDRRALDPKIIGEEFDDYVKKWLEENLDAKKRQTTGGYVRQRFLRRGDAIPLEVYAKLLTVSKKRFANEAELTAWLAEQNFGAAVTKEIMAAVPPTMKVAEDVVLCLELATGKTLWKFKSPGEAVGRMASSTPCVAAGRVFALGSAHAYAVDAQTGALVWKTPLPAKGPASSPLAVDGTLLVNVGRLEALDAASGKSLWVQPRAGGGNSSPVVWRGAEGSLVLCNGRGVLAAVELASGKVRWTVPAGGDCTPVIAGDVVVLQTSNPKVGIMAGRLGAQAFAPLWNIPYDPLRSQSSPLVLGDQVHLIDDNLHWCLDLATGRQHWQEKAAGSSISSPVCVDGKILVLTGGGARIAMTQPSAEGYRPLAKANVRALSVPSPAVADGKLLLRGRKGILCYGLPTADSTASGK